MLLDLVQNIALLLMLVVGLQVLTQRFEKRRVLFRVAAGILFGVVGVVGMMTPLRFDEGVIYDGRSIVLALSGVFVGWISTLIAAVICVVYRIYLGGAGALAGSLVVVEAAILGLYFRRLSQRNERWMNPLSLLGLGVLVHALMVLLQLFIPGELGMAAVSRIGLPVMLFYPPAFLLAASVFLEVERHRAASMPWPGARSAIGHSSRRTRRSCPSGSSLRSNTGMRRRWKRSANWLGGLPMTSTTSSRGS
ncbi:MAG TPA: hypothetical protein DEW46_10555 [Verrucomicrobia bacterium]|jgi:LytS/YehU family sensor histidine kinase|nr:hypothetical protein [Verrucomicrobiota bacterium]